MRRTFAASSVADRIAAFGWHVQRVDGNSIPELVAAFDAARNLEVRQPRAIICQTTMCKGIPFLESREITHFIRVEPDEWAKARGTLDAEMPA